MNKRLLRSLLRLPTSRTAAAPVVEAPRPRVVCLLTFDYELFLGRNYAAAEEVLFAPTREILRLCRALAVPVTFFPDVCSVWSHREHGLHDYSETFEEQMRAALEHGHDVQLHLHPHWLFSTHRGGEWRVATDRMYLSELGFGRGEKSAGAVVQRGVDYLNQLLRPVVADYACTSFRAAGLALQPGERELIGALQNSGIRMDTSIAKGFKVKMDTVSIDYTRTPERSTWLISPETGIHEEAGAGILEMPIGTFQMEFPARVEFLVRRVASVGQMRGTGISRSERQSRLANLYTLLLENVRYVLAAPYFVLSCDTKGFTLDMLLRGFDQYVMNHRLDGDVHVTMINHPKLMFHDQIQLFAAFVEKTRARYDIEFVTCSQALARLDARSR